MTALAPLQTAAGGSETVVSLAIAGMLLAVVLSLAVVYRLVSGYRRDGTRLMLYLGVGLALLVTAPTVLRFLLPTFTDATPGARSLATTVFELLGLSAILYAMYDP
ncbi:hypothetical protein [Halomicrococcus gelatinilyticus]|uniref:hypothetical protein n=1 Tax=Halomicrococcus gelatinilyticus TaxID=1702103 RepID=UPI002E10E9D0